MPRLRCLLPLSIVLFALACSEPPNKELHQAQGAIDAARAAGADQYAPEEFAAAVEALRQAEEAVAQRDHRLALDRALDSRERAQAAAKLGASQKAAVRSEAERLLANVTSTIAQAAARLSAAEAARTPKPALDGLRTALATARAAVDDAGKALAAEDYLAARERLRGVSEALRAAMQAVPATPPAKPARPARRGR